MDSNNQNNNNNNNQNTVNNSPFGNQENNFNNLNTSGMAFNNVDMTNQSINQINNDMINQNINQVNSEMSSQNINQSNNGIVNQQVSNSMTNQSINQVMNNSMASSQVMGSQPVNNNGQTVNVQSIYANQLKNDGQDFSEPKKSKAGMIVGIVLVVLIILLGCGYYFIIDSPKTIFSSFVNKTFSESKIGKNDANKVFSTYEMKYNIDVSAGEYKDYQEIFNIINKFTFKASVGIDKDKDILSLGFKAVYGDDEVINVDAMTNTNSSETVYFDLHDLYDKKIKMSLNDDTGSSNNGEDTDIDTIVESLKKALTETMDTADYSKEIVKLDGKNVKKITLHINNTFVNTLGTKLLNDSNFMSDVSNISGKSEDDIRSIINDYMEMDYKEDISLYLSLFGNDFIRLVIGDDSDNITIWIDGNKYMYEYASNYTLTYKGYVMIDKENSILGINIELVSEGITIGITEKITTSYDKDIPQIDTSNSIDYTELTEEDMSKIIDNLLEKKAINNLIADMGLDQLLNSDFDI